MQILTTKQILGLPYYLKICLKICSENINDKWSIYIFTYFKHESYILYFYL